MAEREADDDEEALLFAEASRLGDVRGLVWTAMLRLREGPGKEDRIGQDIGQVREDRKCNNHIFLCQRMTDWVYLNIGDLL